MYKIFLASKTIIGTFGTPERAGDRIERYTFPVALFSSGPNSENRLGNKQNAQILFSSNKS